ncbi:MAG: hypothetical protein JJU18_08635 [Oceanicaulis sp.]|nr:hypothetical protein [Oceanicaulis sp.]
MSIRVRFCAVWLGVLCALGGLQLTAEAGEVRPARSEEAVLSSISPNTPAMRLTPEARELRIPFTIAPGAEPQSVELVLNASPLSDRSGGEIEVFVNRSRAVALSPRAETFEARFALYSDSLRAGENILVLRLSEGARDGWSVNAAGSRLRVSAVPASGYASLADVEAALRSHFAAPRRIHIDADAAGRDALAVSALIAQGMALRMGEAPILVNTPDVAELTVTANVRSGGGLPAIDMATSSELRLSAGDAGALIASARLFAARSMNLHAVRFELTDALSAPRLERATAPARPGAALDALAAGGAPFGADQGGRAAVVFASADPADRSAALAVVSRAALASGSAWLYAWYGERAEDAPPGHDLMILGPQIAIDPRLIAAAPAEVRAAASAAANRVPRRHNYGSTAFADDSARSARVTGMAALFEEPGGRRVALITSPQGADFSRAATRLARSSLWTGLEGRAVVWDAAAVTSFGPSAAPRFSAEWLSTQIRRHDRWVALGAFSLAVLLLLIGHGVNRTSRRSV